MSISKPTIPGDYNYTQQILLDAYLKGMRFAQDSVDYEPRRAGKSFISLLFLILGTIVFAVQLGQYLLGASDKPVTNVNLVLGTSLFGLQMLFFGVLAKIVVLTRPGRDHSHRR